MRSIVLAAASLSTCMLAVPPTRSEKTVAELKEDGWYCQQTGSGSAICSRPGRRRYFCDEPAKCARAVMLEPRGARPVLNAGTGPFNLGLSLRRGY